jgi:glycosyltransferase involved in cell wall biosynthesis
LAGEALAAAYAAADVLVFPSLTDTFGLVQIEAMACGTPVAAFPVTGPLDVFAGAEGRIGALDMDLRAACIAALGADRGACRAHAERFTWSASAAEFRAALVPMQKARLGALPPNHLSYEMESGVP